VIRRAPTPDAGFSIVLVVFAILILLTLGIAMVSMVVEDSDLSVVHVRENQAFYAAHAGVEYAIVKLSGNWAWGGLASPGKNVGAGSFWIAPPDAVDENGNALPAGRKRIVSNGVVGNTLRQIQVQLAGGGISTYAGTGASGSSGDGGAATLATMSGPGGISIAVNGDLYIADTANNCIRKVSAATGIITTVAGDGSAGFSGDGGLATAAGIKTPEDIFVAANGDLYLADTGHNRIRKVVAATGIISTVAGVGSPGSSGDGGAATLAKLTSPDGIIVAANGDFYFDDRANHRVRKVTAATGIITAFAGTGTAGYSGDGGAATLARLSSPEGIALASNGDVYIADALNHVVRKVTVATGIITTYAGTGTAGSTGDGGAATSARLNGPKAVRLNAAGDLYIADTANNKIRLVTAAGIITTIVGTGTAGSAGDGGSPTAAQLNLPGGIAVSTTGVYYIADSSNNKIRKVSGNLAVVAWVETRT
jgi:sugar lactone lactonase YvrE/Tfp pilus assembly protein PilX